jgi:mono/diheme cytochrome c family protein
MTRFSSKNLLWTAPLVLAGLTGCTRDYKFQPVDMWNGSRLKPYEAVNFFENKGVSQHPPTGTIARGQDRSNEQTFYGTENGALVTYNPIMQAATTPDAKKAVIQRGQERFNIYCQPCHGLGGFGDGMIVKRGFAKPPSYHLDRLRNAPDGHFYDVITNGYGSMYSYAQRVPTRDRWAIVAYIRALQRSQNANASDVPADVKIGTTPQVEPPIGDAHYMGPSAGREYHGTGIGGRGEAGGTALNEEDGTVRGDTKSVPPAEH